MNTQHQRDAAQVHIQVFHQGLLVHHLVHHRFAFDARTHHRQAVGRYVIGLQVQDDRGRDGGRFEHAQEIIAQHLGHLAGSLFLRHEAGSHDERQLFQPGQQGHGLLVGHLRLHHHAHLHVLLEIIRHAARIDQQHGGDTHKQQHQGYADEGGKVSVPEPPPHDSILLLFCHTCKGQFGFKDSENLKF